MRKLRHVDLCSGIGGFSLGLEATGGFRTVAFAEIDAYASAVLKKHWPKVKNYGDIGNVRGIGCEIVTAGFPCQPFSVAGEQRGAADDRHIWPAVRDVVAGLRTDWFIGENVPGIINLELDNCCADLEDLGYEVQPFVIPACAVDARHRRSRIWIIAHALQSGRSTKSWKQQGERAKEFDRSSPGKHGVGYNSVLARERRQPRQGEVETDVVTDAEIAGRQRNDTAGDSRAIRQLGEFRQAVSDDTRNRWIERNSHAAGNATRTNAAKEWTGFSDGSWWSTEPAVGRVADGIPNRVHRLKGLGNAIVPQIAEAWGRLILTVEAQNSG